MQPLRYLFAAGKKRNGTLWKIKRDTVEKKTAHCHKQNSTPLCPKRCTVIPQTPHRKKNGRSWRRTPHRQAKRRLFFSSTFSFSLIIYIMFHFVPSRIAHGRFAPSRIPLTAIGLNTWRFSRSTTVMLGKEVLLWSQTTGTYPRRTHSRVKVR